MQSFHAGIDAGGTTFKCAVFDDKNDIVIAQRFPVGIPEETTQNCIDFFLEFTRQSGRSLQTFGIASFGPLELDKTSSRYGSILGTPKLNWSNYPLKERFERAISLPVQIDTDVNAALLAEILYGAARGVESAAYVTIGTGIGAGLFLNARMVGGRSHPEFGHISVLRHPEDIEATSVCPFHPDCLEGLASAKSLESRFGSALELHSDHIGWDAEAYYLAQACRTLFLTTRLEKIILGGGLMLAPFLLDRVRAEFEAQLSGYLPQEEGLLSELIVTPALGDNAGVMGAMLLGKGAVI